MDFDYSGNDLGRDLIHAAPLGLGIGATCILFNRSRNTNDSDGGSCTNKDGSWNYARIATNTLISVVAIWGFTRWAKNTNGF